MKNHLHKLLSLLGLALTTLLVACSGSQSATETASTTTTTTSTTSSYTVSQEEKDYLKARFDPLLATNSDTIGYVYIPGTKLDEPVVQTTDNSTYLERTFEGGADPYLGTVFMDMDNNKNFQDQLTWLFGHARGSQVPDNRMFNDVNFYDDETYFNEHKYIVIETPERKYYYEVAFMVIVPETTAFYKTEFASNQEFVDQLNAVKAEAHNVNPNITISENDKYLVLSTCREEDVTIRSNLYARQIPDSELEAFLAANGDKLTYQATR